MKHVAKKIVLLLLMTMVMTAMLSVYASAASAAEDSISNITTKVAQYGNDIKEQLKEVNEMIKGKMGGFAGYAGLIVGVLLILECFLSYKLLGFQMFVAGAYVGFAAGLLGYTHLTNLVALPGEYFKWIIAGMVAVIMALIFMWLKKAGLVLFIGLYAFVQLAQHTTNVTVHLAITALIVLLSVFYFRYIFIHATALAGGIWGAKKIFASSLLASVDLSTLIINTRFEPTVYIGLLIAFIGAFVQLKVVDGKRR